MNVIEKAYSDREANNLPTVGLIFKAVLSPLHFRQFGLMIVYVLIDGQEIASGSVNVVLSP